MDLTERLFQKEEANVGLFCDSFPPVMDGVAVCMENYAKWIQKMAGGVKVVTPNVPGTDYSNLGYEVINFLSVPVPQRPPYVTGIAEADPRFLVNISKIRFKILHAHCPFSTGIAARRLARHQGIPLVATFHSKYRDDFARVLPKPVVDSIIKYIIDFYVDARKALGIKPEEFVMLFVGQHIWEKNPRLIIESLAGMGDVPFRMFFVGTGYAAEDMKALVTEKGLDEKVTFVGNITDRQLLTRYYAASDLFLFPSLYDTAGLVVREAASLHTPSVMAEGSTAATALTDGVNGFLVKNNPADMEALLRRLIADPERVRKVGIQALKTIVRSWEDCVGEALDRYNTLLKIRNLPTIERL